MSVDATTVPLSNIALNDDKASDGASPIDPTPGPSGARRVQYYVYCRECKGVQPGKLRVRCSTCKEDTLVLNQVNGFIENLLLMMLVMMVAMEMVVIMVMMIIIMVSVMMLVIMLVLCG